MRAPEPHRFTVEEIAERWSKLYRYEYTPALIVRMGEDGQLKLEVKKERVYPEGMGFLERDAAGITGNFEVRYHYFVTREERDRFERENPPSVNTSDGGTELSPKSRNAFLRLIGYMAERLAEIDHLDIKRPTKAAEQIIAGAARAGGIAGARSGLAETLKAAREVWSESKK